MGGARHLGWSCMGPWMGFWGEMAVGSQLSCLGCVSSRPQFPHLLS